MIRKITRRNLEKFLQRYATDKRVLDLGSGGSDYHRFFPNRVTVDIDPARGPSIVADAQALPFKDGEFEMILCTEMLEHTLDPHRVLDECWRVLKKDGQLILTTRFVYPLHDAPGDYWRFTRPALKKLFSRYRTVSIQPETSEFSTIAVLLERIIFQTSVRGGKVTKGLIFLTSRICNMLDGLVLKRFGDIKKSSEVEEIMASGYYIEATK